ncbi:MAG: DNA-3-methyladenine glycosylase, partial [Phycisphaerales bacterium]
MKRALFRGFGASALELAPTLLGAMLVREIDGVRVAGRIVETEAYPGGDDRGSHSRGGRRTPRNASMFLAGGATYVYLIYGMHHCVNVVSGRAGDGEAVLIRALEPIEGIETMRRLRGDVRDRDLCRGPGRLAAALAIDRTHDGRRLERRAGLWIETGVSPATVACTPRIGLGDVGAWA